MPYAELHAHSTFSFLDGASGPERLVEEAHRLGLSGLAITDHDGFYGIVRFAEAAEAMRGLPQAQQFGVTVWGVRDSDSWLRRADWHNPPEPDNPLLFDDSGRPKASAQAFADALG